MRFQLTGFGMLLVLLTMGCTSPIFEDTIFEAQPVRDPDVARIVTNTQQMSLEFRQLSEQMMVLNRNQELLDVRLAQLEAQTGTAVHSADDVAALRRDVQAIRGEREALRKEITDDLAARIEKIAARQQADINAVRTPQQSARAPTTASAGRSGYEHKVERGQTLSEIARGYGKSVDSIMKANKISNPSLLRAGQILFIPD